MPVAAGRNSISLGENVLTVAFRPGFERDLEKLTRATGKIAWQGDANGHAPFGHFRVAAEMFRDQLDLWSDTFDDGTHGRADGGPFSNVDVHVPLGSTCCSWRT